MGYRDESNELRPIAMIDKALLPYNIWEAAK
jgi:hypothetical protein